MRWNDANTVKPPINRRVIVCGMDGDPMNDKQQIIDCAQWDGTRWHFECFDMVVDDWTKLPRNRRSE